MSVLPPGRGGQRPRKRFGQHFLHDRGVVRRIVSAIAPRPGDNMVEIGPGTGVLSRELLATLDALQAVEIDRDLAASVRQELSTRGLVVHLCDALAFDFASLAHGPRELRVVGNLPYNISTPLLFHLFEYREAISDMHFMLQREVVTRLAAPPGGKDYGRLSVMAQLHCHVEFLFQVAPGAFTPPPRVDSALVRLRPRDRLVVAPEQLAAFGRVVAQAFGQRRKTLRNSLRGLLDAAQMERAGVDPSSRPETLSVHAFAALTHGLCDGQRR